MSNILPFRYLRRLIPDPVRPSKPWPHLAAAVRPNETQAIMRAQSILSGPVLSIGRGLDSEGDPEPVGQCPPLTIEQAHDVLRWAGES